MFFIGTDYPPQTPRSHLSRLGAARVQERGEKNSGDSLGRSGRRNRQQTPPPLARQHYPHNLNLRQCPHCRADRTRWRGTNPEPNKSTTYLDQGRPVHKVGLDGDRMFKEEGMTEENGNTWLRKQ
jgi:hypothetical protein